MRKIIYANNVSLDGFIEDQNGKIDWTAPSEALHVHFNDREKDIDTHLYGRKVYEIMKFWEHADQDSSLPHYMHEYSRIWQQQKKIVFSTTLKSVDNGYELKHSVDPEEINAWKRTSGKNMFVGGASLAASFLKNRLLDEIHLYVIPIFLGGGKPMFPSGEEQQLKLIETKKFPENVVMLKYQLKFQTEAD
ncbi:dihydrofolate reductase family protein [Gracilimonas tropica]|uniref:dihydrofolate reductase family protein n=1 Tax=Gracilimonas tropica TaxID=454600 RepID=UPI0003691DF4|nr:dihydrofolate reductase family protein [Gracilimonas tropica]